MRNLKSASVAKAVVVGEVAVVVTVVELFFGVIVVVVGGVAKENGTKCSEFVLVEGALRPDVLVRLHH